MPVLPVPRDDTIACFTDDFAVVVTAMKGSRACNLLLPKIRCQTRESESDVGNAIIKIQDALLQKAKTKLREPETRERNGLCGFEAGKTKSRVCPRSDVDAAKLRWT